MKNDSNNPSYNQRSFLSPTTNYPSFLLRPTILRPTILPSSYDQQSYNQQSFLLTNIEQFFQVPVYAFLFFIFLGVELNGFYLNWIHFESLSFSGVYFYFFSVEFDLVHFICTCCCVHRVHLSLQWSSFI